MTLASLSTAWLSTQAPPAALDADPLLSFGSLLPLGLGALGGLLLGAVVVWLGSAPRRAALLERLATREADLATARARSAEAEAEARGLREALVAERARREGDLERLAWIHTADEQLHQSFEAAASQVVRRGSGELVDRADERLRRLLEPVQAALGSLDSQVRQLEIDRRGAYDGLRQELHLLRDAHGTLERSAQELRRTLSAPGGRGRWGEHQLRRLIEMAGMVEHVDFEQQVTTGSGSRPDMVVHLADGAVLPIDAKAPFGEFLAAIEADDVVSRRAALKRHLDALRRRTIELSDRAYWRQFEQAPDFVVLFLPHEGALSAAFEADPQFLDFSMARRVLPATPVTLLALLRSVAWGWRQQTVAVGAQRVAKAGRDLHQRLLPFLDHLGRLGRSIDGSVEAYNRALGSLERRVLPAVRRLEEAAATSDTATTPDPLVGRPRPPSLDTASNGEAAAAPSAEPAETTVTSA